MLQQKRRLNVALAVLIGALWPVLCINYYGSPTALLHAAQGGPSIEVVHHDLPNAVLFAKPGHDGQQFYAIARDPFSPHRVASQLDLPVRRYRRILYPLLAGLISPGKGLPLVYSLTLVSLIGLAIGCWALSTFPDAPLWLPFSMTLNPAIFVSLFLSLSDVLATGLVLATFAAAFHRKWWFAAALAVLACLTRETSIVAVACIAFWPRTSVKDRLRFAMPPVLVTGAWALTAAYLMRGVSDTKGAPVFVWPFVGWIHGVGPLDVVVPAALCLLLVFGLCARGTPLPIRLFLGANLVQAVCLGHVVTFSWINSTRAIAPAVPLAFWAIYRRPARRVNSRHAVLA